ncbi:MAG TPA: FlgO family outer membrane protein [Thermoanaerobaculia bacterium]
MRTLALMLTLLLTCSAAAEPLEDAIDTLAREISSSVKEQKKRKIAILPFDEAKGKESVLSTYVPETLVTNLFRLGRFEIVERQMLDKVIAEVRQQRREGAFDPKTAAEVGRIAGVEAIVTGTITDFPTYVGINCRIIDTTTATVFGAANTTIAKDANLRGTIKEVAMAGAKLPAITPDERPSFSNAYIHVEVESAERKGDVVTLTLNAQSRSSKPYSLWMSNISMLDENGENWGCKFDSGNDSVSFELHPRTRQRLRASCRPATDNSGTRFTLLTEHGGVSIEDIVPVVVKK